MQNAERKLQTEISNVVHGIRNDFEAAQSRERALMAALERQKAAVQALNAKSVEYTALEREATSNREVLDKLLQRSREAALGSELQSSNIRIVDPATVPDVADPAAQEPQRHVGSRRGRSLRAGARLPARDLQYEGDVAGRCEAAPADLDPRHRAAGEAAGWTTLAACRGWSTAAQFAEFLNAVRTNLLLAPGLSTLRTLLVTSSEPGEGKTMAAANLAVSLARLNQRVLLIDADLRRPRLHQVFGVEQQPGLTDVLTGKVADHRFRRRRWPGCG